MRSKIQIHRQIGKQLSAAQKELVQEVNNHVWALKEICEENSIPWFDQNEIVEDAEGDVECNWYSGYVKFSIWYNSYDKIVEGQISVRKPGETARFTMSTNDGYTFLGLWAEFLVRMKQDG